MTKFQISFCVPTPDSSSYKSCKSSCANKTQNTKHTLCRDQIYKRAHTLPLSSPASAVAAPLPLPPRRGLHSFILPSTATNPNPNPRATNPSSEIHPLPTHAALPPVAAPAELSQTAGPHSPPRPPLQLQPPPWAASAAAPPPPSTTASAAQRLRRPRSSRRQ